MSERITEAELAELVAEEEAQRDPFPPRSARIQARLIAEVRRLRGLIVAVSDWRHESPRSGCIWCGARAGLSDHSAECPFEIETEAEAIREEK